MASDYPARPAFFAVKYCRLLTKSAAAMQLGADVCWMLTVIVHQEDSARYRKPIDYWNEQLMALCGFGSRRRLITARAKAVELGWLCYEKGGNRKPGRYFVAVPDGYSIANDSGPCHENDEVQIAVQRHDTELEQASEEVQRHDTGRKAELEQSAMRNSNRAPSIPNPNPIPKKKSASYSDDFEAFWKAFPKGRKTGKKAAFKAWHQAIKEIEPQTIIDAAAEYGVSDVGRGQYVKGPAPWLNGGCWDDDREAWKDKPDRKKNETSYENLDNFEDIA